MKVKAHMDPCFALIPGCLIAEGVFILEHYFASKSFAAIREAFNNAYPDSEAPNKTTLHRLVIKFRVT